MVFDNVTEPKNDFEFMDTGYQLHKICAAENHSTIITTNGYVYSWKQCLRKIRKCINSEVENQTFQDIQQAQLVNVPDGTRLELGRSLAQRAMPDRGISSIGNHVIAINMIGTVYTWGNGSGRLGLNNIDTVPFPTVLNLARFT